MKKYIKTLKYCGYDIEIFHHILLDRYMYEIKDELGENINKSNVINIQYDDLASAYVSACLEINEII